VLQYILRRLGFILLTMLLASIIIFAATQLLPGDVAQMIMGRWASEKALENLREQLGLHRPVYVQYLYWVGHFFIGDWGKSLMTGVEVRPLVMRRLRNSAMLAGLSLVFYVPLGVFLGVIAALKHDKPIDELISAASMAFVGLPEFVTGLLLMIVSPEFRKFEHN